MFQYTVVEEVARCIVARVLRKTKIERRLSPTLEEKMNQPDYIEFMTIVDRHLDSTTDSRMRERCLEHKRVFMEQVVTITNLQRELVHLRVREWSLFEREKIADWLRGNKNVIQAYNIAREDTKSI